jgi:23S rRNA pseudouridine2605 synthase
MATDKSKKTRRSTSASSKVSASSPDSTDPGPQRLQRVMAAAGIGSRRECELLIQEGRVEVDGQIFATLGVKVDPHKQKIFVDGQRLVAQKLQYFMLNKPPGVVSTSDDPAGRARVIDLIKTDQRVYNVGRLDQSSEGLILVTNDGELANRLTHPRYGIEKKYHVQVAGVPSTEQLKQLEAGVYIAEGKAKATSAKFLRKVKSNSWIEIVLAEGRNREIRRMLASIGHKVRTLKRVAIGPLKMGDLPIGAHRPLTSAELKTIKRAAQGLSTSKRSSGGKKKTGKKFSKPIGGLAGKKVGKKVGKKPGSKSSKKPVKHMTSGRKRSPRS